MFKNHQILDKNVKRSFFQSSGTTQMNFQNILLPILNCMKKVFIKALNSLSENLKILFSWTCQVILKDKTLHDLYGRLSDEEICQT
jgi:hypothetical protein